MGLSGLIGIRRLELLSLPQRSFITLTNITMEEFRDIPWYEGYQVSNLWRLKSLERKMLIRWKHPWISKERILKTTLCRWYEQTNIKINWKRKLIRIHRAVCLAFIPNPENKPQVNHKNGIRIDNRVENLERCTNQENQIHSNYILWTGNLWKRINENMIKIKQKDLQWNIIRIRDCITDAEKIWLWKSKSIWHISAVCKWKRKQAYGFIWEYM